MVPRGADVGQIPRADLDRRKPLDVGRAVPGQERGRAIDARMTEPRLGRADQAARRDRAMLAGEDADDVRRTIVAACANVPIARQTPWPRSCGRRHFARRRLVVERRQRFAGLVLPGRDQLRHGERADLPRLFRRIDVRDRRVRRAQVEADDVAAGGGFGCQRRRHRTILSVGPICRKPSSATSPLPTLRLLRGNPAGIMNESITARRTQCGRLLVNDFWKALIEGTIAMITRKLGLAFSSYRRFYSHGRYATRRSSPERGSSDSRSTGAEESAPPVGRRDVESEAKWRLIQLLTLETVQKDLGLSAEQINKIKENFKIGKEVSKRFYAKLREILPTGQRFPSEEAEAPSGSFSPFGTIWIVRPRNCQRRL